MREADEGEAREAQEDEEAGTEGDDEASALTCADERTADDDDDDDDATPFSALPCFSSTDDVATPTLRWPLPPFSNMSIHSCSVGLFHP